MIRARRALPAVLAFSFVAGWTMFQLRPVAAHEVRDDARKSKRNYDPEQLFQEKWIRHQLVQRQIEKEGAARAAARSMVADVQDIAVIQATSDLVLRENLWSLNSRSILFTPTGNGYRVTSSAQPFETNFGPKLDMAAGVNPTAQAEPGDDAYVLQTLAFPFTLYGRTYSAMAISSNGNITFRPDGISQQAFDEGTVDSSESLSELQSGLPRIAPYWHDLDARPVVTQGDRGVYFRAEADRVIVTWNRLRDFPNTSSDNGEATFQAILFRDGRILFSYQVAILTSTALVGIGPGGASGIPDVIRFISPPAETLTNAIAEFFSTATVVDDFGVIKRFYETRPGGRDVWDFVYLITDFQSDLGDAFAFYLPIRNEIRGIGDRIRNFDPNGTIFGSRRLEGYLNLASLAEPDPFGYPDLPTTRFLGSNSGLSIMAQEQGHRWGTFIKFPGANENFLLGRDNQHWSFFAHVESTLSTPAAPRSSGMEGNVWRENSNGTFTSIGLVDGYTRYDHYLMGLRPPGEVGAMFVIDGPSGSGRNRSSNPRPNVTTAGTRRTISIEEVIQANGPRIPDAATAPKKWRVAWIFLTAGGLQPSEATLRKLARYQLSWESYFAQSTDFLGEIDSSLAATNSEIRRIAVTSGADFSPAVAPGAIATIFGRGLTSGRTERNASIDLPTSLAGTQVLVDGRPAQLYLASPDQVNFVLPRSTVAVSVVPGGQVSSGTAFIEVIRDGQLVRAGTVQVAPSVPSIFSTNSTGSGPGAILDAVDFSAPPIAARRPGGEPNILAIFCTGIGADATDTTNNLASEVQARINGQPASVAYAGRSGFPGMNQVNVVLPAGLGAGTYNVQLIRNGIASNTVTVQLR